VVLRIRLQSHQVHPTMLQYYTVRMHAIYSQMYTQMNISTVKWAQWDKTQSIELLGLFKWVCSSLCTIVAHNTAQNRPDNFPSCPPDHCSDDVYLRERGNDQNTTWYGCRPRPRQHCVIWGPSSPHPRKGALQSPHFSVHDYCGQTVAHLSSCWDLVA